MIMEKAATIHRLSKRDAGKASGHYLFDFLIDLNHSQRGCPPGVFVVYRLLSDGQLWDSQHNTQCEVCEH